ncbi:hypothetical protein MWN40_07480, partial [Ornithobacterium rhinotracheale]|nr:hypothetical protein [Ornithobacterium rhinotracheale]
MGLIIVFLLFFILFAFINKISIKQFSRFMYRYSLFLVLISQFLFSQTNKVIGKVIDDNYKFPVEFVNAKLILNDSIYSKVTTDDNGIFTINANNGKYILEIERLGEVFLKKEIEVLEDLDLGEIPIQESVKLKSLSIDAKKPLIQQKVDRLVFNVDNSVAAQGLNAKEILKITPSIILEKDNISLAGKDKVLVLINDKP